MTPSPIKLVILDLDGTLLDPDREAPIRPPVVSAVRKVLDLGVRVTLATGRTWEYARHRAQELGLDPAIPMVTGQGASLVESGSGKIFSEAYLPPDLARRVASRAQTRQEVMSLYYRDPAGRLHITLNQLEQPMEYYSHLLGPETEIVVDFTRYLDWNLLKFVVFSDASGDLESWKSWVGDEAHLGRTHAALIEGTARGVDKGTGVRGLLKLLEVDPGTVLAIGDQENDIPMFAAVGHTAAMGHAPDSVKARAKFVAPSFANDGVAGALEHFFPNGAGLCP